MGWETQRVCACCLHAGRPGLGLGPLRDLRWLQGPQHDRHGQGTQLRAGSKLIRAMYASPPRS